MLLHGLFHVRHGLSLYNGVDIGYDPSKHFVLNALVIVEYVQLVALLEDLCLAQT